MSQSEDMLEAKVSEILENILGLLSLEGSFEVEEQTDLVVVSIETNDAGRLIGRQGENLYALQLIVNQILSRQLLNEDKADAFKKVAVDVANWKKDKESELVEKAKKWAEQVLSEGLPLELEPMPSWQRRIVHLTLQEVPGVESESSGEGDERHLTIKPVSIKDAAPKEPALS